MLLTKILKLDAFNLIMTLMKSENPEIKDYTVKFLSLLLFKSPDFVKEFNAKNGFKLLNECLNLSGTTSRNLLKTLIELSTN